MKKAESGAGGGKTNQLASREAARTKITHTMTPDCWPLTAETERG
jgi:hypothetical protein